MSDLSNLLGDLYSGGSPDGPSVRHEPAAADRRTDDDLAAALSAALSDAPSPVASAPAPAPAMPDLGAPLTPAEAFAEAAPRGGWTSAPAPVSEPVHAPAMAQTHSGPRMWARGDDDIFPMGGAAKKRK